MTCEEETQEELMDMLACGIGDGLHLGRAHLFPLNAIHRGSQMGLSSELNFCLTEDRSELHWAIDSW